MTSVTLKDIRDLALELPAEQRVALAHELLASLDGLADADAAHECDVEIGRRLDEFEAVEGRTIDAEEVLRGIDAVLRSD